MAIIFAGTSLADFHLSGPIISTTANKTHTVNEAFYIESVSDFAFANIPNTSDLWLSLFMHSNSFTDLAQFIQFFSTAYSETNALFTVYHRSSIPRQVGIKAYNGTALVDLGPNTGASPANTVTRYDIHIKIADAGGECEIYVNGERQFIFSGDTNLVANSGINRVTLRQAGPGTSDTTYSAVIIADEDTRGMEFLQSKPTGNGGAVGWAGAYTDVDEIGYSDADFISTETIGATETYTKAALPAGYATGYDVAAVVLGARAQAVSAKLVGAFRIGGTNYEGNSLKATVGLANSKQSVNAVNPATGLPWTFAEVDALEFGVKLIAP